MNNNESSGGQALPAAPVDWGALARGLGIGHVARTADVDGLVEFPWARAAWEPALLVVDVAFDPREPILPYSERPDEIRARSRSQTAAGVRVGVDVGGTFTDLVAWGCPGARALKVPTTPDNPAGGVLTAWPRSTAWPAPAPRSPTAPRWSPTPSSSAASAQWARDHAGSAT